MTQLKKTSTGIAKEVVLNLLNAINEEKFEAAKKLAKPDMRFDGVLGQRDSAEAYFKDMEKMKMKYEIKKAFADADDVCILSDITMGEVTMFTCSWYKLEDDKIKSLKVVFDPRPALEKSAKK